jgi:hypothetical protein
MKVSPYNIFFLVVVASIELWGATILKEWSQCARKLKHLSSEFPSEINAFIQRCGSTMNREEHGGNIVSSTQFLGSWNLTPEGDGTWSALQLVVFEG